MLYLHVPIGIETKFGAYDEPTDKQITLIRCTVAQIKHTSHSQVSVPWFVWK